MMQNCTDKTKQSLQWTQNYMMQIIKSFCAQKKDIFLNQE